MEKDFSHYSQSGLWYVDPNTYTRESRLATRVAVIPETKMSVIMSLDEVADHFGLTTRVEDIEQSGFCQQNLWQWSALAVMFQKTLVVGDMNSDDPHPMAKFFPDGMVRYASGDYNRKLLSSEPRDLAGMFRKRPVILGEVATEHW